MPIIPLTISLTLLPHILSCSPTTLYTSSMDCETSVFGIPIETPAQYLLSPFSFHVANPGLPNLHRRLDDAYI